MLAFVTLAGALIVPAALLDAPPRPDCQLAPLHHTTTTSDERLLARFTAAAHDYVAYGRQGAIIDAEVAELVRFRLLVTRWLYRLDAAETLSDLARRDRGRRAWAAAAISPVAALPPLPEQLAYRLDGDVLLLIDARTREVVDLVDAAFTPR